MINIVVRYDDCGAEFCVDRRGTMWSREYPDAFQFEGVYWAKKTAFFRGAKVMQNYGMEDERVVADYSDDAVRIRAAMKAKTRSDD